MFAIIVTGGKQYKVNEGDVIFVEKLDAQEEAEVTFDEVLSVVDGSDVKLGKPFVNGVKVTGKVLRQGKDKKIYVFKYKSKKNEKKKQGHRQPYTKIQITKIG